MSGRDPFDFDGDARDVGSARPAVPAATRPGASTAPASVPHEAPFDRLTGWEQRDAARPPVAWLLAALAVAVLAGLGAAGIGGGANEVGVAFLCWVFAGPVAIGLISVFVMRDTHARSQPLYVRPPWIGPLFAVTVVAVVAGIGTSAWRIADWWGRL